MLLRSLKSALRRSRSSTIPFYRDDAPPTPPHIPTCSSFSNPPGCNFNVCKCRRTVTLLHLNVCMPHRSRSSSHPHLHASIPSIFPPPRLHGFVLPRFHALPSPSTTLQPRFSAFSRIHVLAPLCNEDPGFVVSVSLCNHATALSQQCAKDLRHSSLCATPHSFPRISTHSSLSAFSR